MANTTPERYRFDSLEKMDRAILAAFGTPESSACSFEKGLVLIFMPSGSRVFDTRTRSIIGEYGGKLISEDEISEVQET